MLPEVDFWCSPVELELELGQRPGEGGRVSPVVGETNTTDHCLMMTEGANTTQCSRWDFDRSVSPESVVSEFSLVCSNDGLRSVSSSVYMASKMGASIVWGLLSDRFGRKKAILACAVSLTLTGVASSFSPNMITFIILRGSVAFCATGLFLCGFVYSMELVGGLWSTLVSFGLEYSWALGYLTLPLLAWALPRWNNLQLGISAPSLVFALLLAIPGLLPESPRWLLVKGRREEAELVIEKARRVNRMEEEKVEVAEPAESGQEKSEQANPGSVVDLFRLPALRRSTLIMYYLWFTNNLVYYGFTLNAGKLFPGDLHINILISAALEFLAYTVSIFSFLYLGRRWSISAFMGVGGVSLLLTMALPTEATKSALSQLGKFMITASFAMVYQYSTEVFPTVVRNAGLGSCSFFSRIGSIIAPFIGREMAQVSPIAPVLIFGVTSVLAGGLTLLLPETKGRTSPDTIQVSGSSS